MNLRVAQSLVDEAMSAIWDRISPRTSPWEACLWQARADAKRLFERGVLSAMLLDYYYFLWQEQNRGAPRADWKLFPTGTGREWVSFPDMTEEHVIFNSARRKSNAQGNSLHAAIFDDIAASWKPSWRTLRNGYTEAELRDIQQRLLSRTS